MDEPIAVGPAHRASPPRGLLVTLLALRGPYAFLIALAPGFLLVLFSILIGVHDFTIAADDRYVPVAEGGKAISRQVGYLFAPNWSINYLLLLPLAVYLMLEVIGGFYEALEQLYEREMVRDQSFAVVNDLGVVAAWVSGTRLRTILLVVLAVALPAIVSYLEWYPNNYQRVLQLGGPAPAPKDYDWGLRALVEQWTPWGRRLNVAFDFLAFTCQAILLGTIIAFFLVCLDFARAIGHAPRLVPDLRSGHERRGFEDFEHPLRHLLIVTLVAYLMCYFVRLENVYLASPGFSSLGDFVNRDILNGVVAAVQGGSGWRNELPRLFAVAAPVSRQAFLAGSAAFILLVFTFQLVVMTVGSAASRARATALRHFNARGNHARVLFDMPPAEERDQLRTMNVWPLGYFTLNALLTLAFMALATLYYYRIGLFAFGFIVLLILGRLLSQAIRRGAVT